MACVWTARSATGTPQKLFGPRNPVSLIAAWQLGVIPNLSHYHLSVAWAVYAVYQPDVSLLPPAVYRVAQVSLRDPSPPQTGVFRLVKAPQIFGLPPGWYSITAQAFLTGGKCPRRGCSGQVRQNRFRIR